MGVEVKSSKDGFRIIIDPEENIDSVKEKLVEKFDKSLKFFKGATFTNIEKGNLIAEDINNLKSFLVDKYDMKFNTDVIDVSKVDTDYYQIRFPDFDSTIDKVKKITEKKHRVIDLEENDNNLKTKFIFENMRSGAEISYNGNVVLFGDLNPGAKIIALGNIIIMGVCRGTVHAGENSKENRFISALRLKPIQMKVNGKFALPPDDADFIENAIVKIIDNEIVIEQF